MVSWATVRASTHIQHLKSLAERTPLSHRNLVQERDICKTQMPEADGKEGY